jgi:hypothetical protein
MQPASSQQQNTPAPDADLGAERYVYRYPTGAKVFAILILLLIPVATAGFIQLVLRAGSLSDRLIPAIMAIVIIGCALFLSYRQAYFGWAVVTIYERGLRFDFWRKHLVIPWTNLGKFYLGPGRMANWHITDRDEHILCELRTSLVGRASSPESETSASVEPAPSIIDALVEEGGLIEREEPFRHYAPGPRSSRRERKKKA